MARKGWTRFDVLNADPAYRKVREDPAFRELVEEMAGGWIDYLRGLEPRGLSAL